MFVLLMWSQQPPVTGLLSLGDSTGLKSTDLQSAVFRHLIIQLGRVKDPAPADKPEALPLLYIIVNRGVQSGIR